MSYTHLSQDERYQIQHLHGGNFSSREIAIELKRAATTISRELRRNQSSASRTATEYPASARSERASSDRGAAVVRRGSTTDR